MTFLRTLVSKDEYKSYNIRSRDMHFIKYYDYLTVKNIEDIKNRITYYKKDISIIYQRNIIKKFYKVKLWYDKASNYCIYIPDDKDIHQSLNMINDLIAYLNYSITKRVEDLKSKDIIYVKNLKTKSTMHYNLVQLRQRYKKFPSGLGKVSKKKVYIGTALASYVNIIVSSRREAINDYILEKNNLVKTIENSKKIEPKKVLIEKIEEIDEHSEEQIGYFNEIDEIEQIYDQLDDIEDIVDNIRMRLCRLEKFEKKKN